MMNGILQRKVPKRYAALALVLAFLLALSPILSYAPSGFATGTNSVQDNVSIVQGTKGVVRVSDAASVQSVVIDDQTINPLGGYLLQGDTLELAASTTGILASGAHTMVLAFPDGEERVTVNIEDPAPAEEPTPFTDVELLQDQIGDTAMGAAVVGGSGVVVSPFATAPGTINATIIDDTGLPVDLSGTDDEAIMSYQQQQNHVPNLYDLKIMLTGLDTSKTNSLTVVLPLGMKFQYTNINTFLAQSGQFALDVASSSYTHAGYTSYAGHTFSNGSYTFTLKAGVGATTVTIPIGFEPVVNTDTITNAAQITLTDGTATTSETLEKVTRQTDTYMGFALGSGHPHSGAYFVFTDGDVLTMDPRCRTMCTAGSGNPYYMFVSGATIALKLNDVNSPTAARAKIICADTSGEWVLTPVNTATGDYVLTYTPTGGYARISSIAAPIDIEFESGSWVDGDPVKLEYIASGTFFDYVQFDENDPAGNIGSSKSATAVRQNLSTDYVHEFRYQLPDEKVFVNYASNTTYLDNAAKGPATNLSFKADIDRANPDPAKNDETGVLGYFLMGNAGTVDSTPKTVEMHFGSTTYGVMALYVPYRAGETLTKVEYTTSKNGSWQTATVNAKADATTGKAYLSYVALGIADRTEFITGIRYEFGAVPAGSYYTQEVFPGAPYYGKWLGANDNTSSETATIRVYDTTGPIVYDTGNGTVTTTRIDTNAAGSPSSANIAVTAGEVMNFGITITTGDNTKYMNNTTEHPIIYIRSEVVDQNGNPLPLSNIVLKNNGRIAGELDSSEYDITSWIANEGGKKVAIYKIDTSSADPSKVVLSPAYITSGGSLSSNTLSLSYQIATTALTPSQEYLSRDMVYVFDPDATSYTAASNSRRVGSTDVGYESLRNGEDWTKGVLIARSVQSVDKYKINSVQSILVTSQIKHLAATSWSNYTTGSTPIPVGISASSGFQLKTNVVNNAGTTVFGTEVYVPIPKAGEDWGNLIADDVDLSLMLKGAAAVTSVGSGTIGSYTIKYGINVAPTDNGYMLQGYSWVDAASVSDWSKVNCVQIVANNILDKADLQVILDVKADENQTVPALEEGLVDIWHPTYYQDLSSSTGVYQGWYPGGDFGVQSALSGIKGRLFNDANKDGIYQSATETTTGTGWKVRVYLASDTSSALQEANVNTDGTYAFYDLVSKPDYILEAVSPDNTSYMFTTTATRVQGNGTGSYEPYGANTFTSSDGDATATAPANAIATEPGLTPPNDIDNAATYNIGIVEKAVTTLTWQSSDLVKGTVAGDSGTGVKTLVDYPTTALPTGAAPPVTAATGYTFMGWARVASGSAVPAWDATPWKTAIEVLNKDFGSGNNTYGFTGYDYYAVYSANTYTVTFDINGADSDPTDYPQMNVAYNTKIKEATGFPADPVRDGYVFRGWQMDTAGTPWLLANTTMPAQDVVLTAIWEKGTVVTVGDITIIAQDFILSIAEAQVHQSGTIQQKFQDLITFGLAKAWWTDTLQDVAISAVAVQPSTGDGKSIDAIVGDYDVTYYASDSGKTAQVTILATVYDSIGGSGIGGNDFTYNVSGGSLSAIQVISKGSVTVYDEHGRATSETPTIDATDHAYLNDMIAALAADETMDVPVKFTNAAGDTTTIIVTIVRDKDPVIPPVDPPVTPNTPGPVTPGTTSTTETITYTTIVQNFVTTIEEAVDALVDTLSAPFTEIDENETPLAERDANCWVHFYVIGGLLVTAAYSVGVLLRRRKFINDLNDYDDQVLGGRLSKGGMSSHLPTPSANDGRVSA